MSRENKIIGAAILGISVLYVAIYWAIGSLIRDCSNEIDCNFDDLKIKEKQ